MFSYSIAIRTLGTAGQKFREELESIAAQSVKPEKVVVYIAEGYPRPDFTVGQEEYVWVKKGMIAQRVLDYDDITSDVIFFLDDDVRLAPDSAEKLLRAMEMHHFDAIGVDIFRDHKMHLAAKIYSACSNIVLPHWSRKWAFLIHRNGSFSYLNNPRRDCYLSQSCAGPAWMIKKEIYDKLHFDHELWLDDLGFPYGEDALESYKIYRNGYRLGIHYNSGCTNLDAKTSSRAFKNSDTWLRNRTIATVALWWRMIYQPATSLAAKSLAVVSFLVKITWLFVVFLLLSLAKFSLKPVTQYVNGLIDGRRYVKSSIFTKIPSYVID